MVVYHNEMGVIYQKWHFFPSHVRAYLLIKDRYEYVDIAFWFVIDKKSYFNMYVWDSLMLYDMYGSQK